MDGRAIVDTKRQRAFWPRETQTISTGLVDMDQVHRCIVHGCTKERECQDCGKCRFHDKCLGGH